jgi:hypothetical protein
LCSPDSQFKVECSEVTYFTVLVEAETEDEARELAHANINSFPVEEEYVSEWTIESVEEL